MCIRDRRKIDPKILAITKTNRLDLSQDLPVKIINVDPALKTFSDFGASAIFNTFDLQQNQSYYQNIKDLVVNLNYSSVGDSGTIHWIYEVLNRQFGFLFNAPDWLHYDQTTIYWSNLDSPIKSNLIRNVEIKSDDQTLANRLFQEFNGKFSNYDNGLPLFNHNNNFKLKKISPLSGHITKQNPTFIKDGVLNYAAYIKQFNPEVFATGLINYQDQIKAIDFSGTTTIKANSLAGLNFATELKIDLKPIKIVEEYGFSGSNFNYQTLDFSQFSYLGAFAFSQNSTLDLVDFSNTQLTKLNAGLFWATPIKTLKLAKSIKTIASFAFANTNLVATKDQPLDLTNLNYLDRYAFSNNLDLENVVVGKDFQIFQGFENSGLTTFDFTNIKVLNYDGDDQLLNLPKFQDQVLNLINVVNFSGNLALPSVNKIILNPQLKLTNKILGLTNLKTIVNYHNDINPQFVFGPTTNITYELIDQIKPIVIPSAIGYDPDQGILDWTILANFSNPKQIDNEFNQFIYQTNLYFQAHPDAIIKQFILPATISDSYSTLDYQQLINLKLPPITKLTIAKSNFYFSDQIWSAFNKFLTKQTITELDHNFFANFGGSIPDHFFKDISFKNNEQVIDLSGITMVGEYAFWNSSLKYFKNLPPNDPNTNPNLIKNYAFNPDTSITIPQGYQWTNLSFGLSNYQPLSPTIIIEGQIDQNDPTWGGYYDPKSKVLDFSNLAPFQTKFALEQFLNPIKKALNNTIINVLVLPQWNIISSDWLNDWLIVNKLVISPKTTIFGIYDYQYTSLPLYANRLIFKTIPKLNHTNIINDYSDFWKEV